MISDFVGSLLLGSVFIRCPQMKQMIFTLTRWVGIPILLRYNFGVWLVTLRATHFWAPYLPGVPPSMKQMIFTLTRWVLYANTTEINFWCMVDFAGSPLSGPVFIRGPPHGTKEMIFTLARWVRYAYNAEINFLCMINEFEGRPVTHALFQSRPHANF